MSAEATSISNLTKRTETKKYTTARIRRAIWNSYFGVTSSDIRTMPSYTQVLAMDSHGRAMLKKIGKQSHFPILTKPSNTDFLPDSAKLQKDLSDKADSIFQLSKPQPKDGKSALRFTPFVKL